MEIRDTSIFAPAPLCVSRFDKKAETVELVRIGQRTQVFKIDGVSAYIWQQINGKTSVGQIVKKVLNEFEVTPTRAKRDIRKVLYHFLSLEVIQEREK